MKIKSNAVRRNSSGYRLREDESVSGSPAVVSDCSVRPDADDLGVGHSFLVGSGSVSNCVVNEGDQFGDFMDVDDGLVPDHVWDSLGATPMRMTGGIVINEPGSSCEPGVNRCQRLPELGGYVGKGKGKVDYAPPLPSHVSYTLGGSAAAGFLDAYWLPSSTTDSFTEDLRMENMIAKLNHEITCLELNTNKAAETRELTSTLIHRIDKIVVAEMGGPTRTLDFPATGPCSVRSPVYVIKDNPV